jgi:type I restriction enzyme, R subunit
VIDRETIDTNEPFASDGGFKRLNKVFDGELRNIIAGINEEMWKRTG